MPGRKTKLRLCSWHRASKTSPHGPDIRSRVGLLKIHHGSRRSHGSRRNGPWLLPSLWTLQTDPELNYTPRSVFLVSHFDTAAGGVEPAVLVLARPHHVAATSLFPCGPSPAGSPPAQLLSKLLSSLLPSPLVALLSLLRMKYCGRPSSALLLSRTAPSWRSEGC